MYQLWPSKDITSNATSYSNRQDFIRETIYKSIGKVGREKGEYEITQGLLIPGERSCEKSSGAIQDTCAHLQTAGKEPSWLQPG